MLRFWKKYQNPDCAMLVLRLAVGAIFIMAGWTKLQNIAGTANFFSTLGLGMMWVYIVAWVEFLGGIAILAGAFSRVAGLLLAIDMAFAIYLVGWAKGFAGYRLELLLLAAVLAIHFAGPGRYAIWKKW
jgi:putative oxidoreductase